MTNNNRQKHEGRAWFQCDHCECNFTEKGSLRKHLKEVLRLNVNPVLMRQIQKKHLKKHIIHMQKYNDEAHMPDTSLKRLKNEKAHINSMKHRKNCECRPGHSLIANH